MAIATYSEHTNNPAVAAAGVQSTVGNTEGKEVRLWNTGRAWKLFDLGTESIERYGFPYVTVFRPDLLQVLADAVRAIDGLGFHRGIPPRIENEHVLRGGEVQA